MRLLIASDIHGSALWLKKLLEIFEEKGADRLVLAGDLLNHGPRNGLSEGYDPVGTAALLNSVKHRLLTVRGNCDSEVDQMLLEFPALAEYALLDLDGRAALLSHGHRKSEHTALLHPGDVYISGHTHVPALEKNEIYEVNPGSAAFPRGERSFVIYEKRRFALWNFDGAEIKTLDIT